MDMEFLMALPFRRKDGKIFDIEVVRTEHDGSQCYAVRVWHDEILVNNPRAEFYRGTDAAYQQGLDFAKDYKK